jgi:hypothetical protein
MIPVVEMTAELIRQLQKIIIQPTALVLLFKSWALLKMKFGSVLVQGANMKKNVTIGAVVIALGLLIALGPQFLFKVCAHGETGNPHCHWSAQAEIGIGLLIAALGACMIVFNDQKTHLGLLVGIFLASIIALTIPNTLIGGCSMMTMQCRKVAFPALTAESVVLLVFSAIMITVIAMCPQRFQTPK